MLYAFCFSACADDVEAYLEQQGLTQLLAVHLEQQMAGASPEQRETIVRRLADIYAQLLERENDPARRIAIEQRSRQLLQQAPARSADDLRLALLRASYRTAEKIAENHRLRMAREEELETARRTFDELVPPLQSLRKDLNDNVQQLDRRSGRAAGAEAYSLNEAIDRARNLYSQCTFLTAWALYYQDWMQDGPQDARLAEPLFAEVMGSDSPTPNPEEVSVDLRSNEAVARSILGMGLCKSLTSSSATAESWITLLTHPEAFEALRTQAPAWMIAIHLEHHEYRNVQDVLKEAASTQPQVPIAWLRLIAVHALEDRNRDRFAEELVRGCVTELATRGELQQVLDLASRYGVEAIGGSGFALEYVKGIIQYQEARDRHASEEPTFDSAIQERYRGASASLQAAAAQSDAKNYPLAAAACKRLIAWCSFFQGNFLDAREQFESAATALSGEEATDALWMAIVSLDKIAEAGHSPEVQSQLDGLIDRFVAQYPENVNTPKLVLRRSLRDRKPSPQAVAELLAIGPETSIYATAQSRAADMLYQLFRKARPNDRPLYAGQFLSVAVPLISQPPTGAAATGADEMERFSVRCRQVLEVALSEGIERLVAARTALQSLEGVADHASVSPHRDEIDCRRVQERLYTGAAEEAAKVADALWDRDSSSIWSRLAVRSMFKQAHQVWKSPDAAAAERDAALERVVRYGGRVLHEFEGDRDTMQLPGSLAYHTAVAQATMESWEKRGDIDRAKASLFLFDLLLRKRPNNASFLRSAAILSEKLDQPEQALEHWRKIVAGTPVGGEGWYEAKFHQILVLSKVDPAKARQVMDQHKQLNPEYGPDPWGQQLKGLDAQIPPAQSALRNGTVPRLTGAVVVQLHMPVVAAGGCA